MQQETKGFAQKRRAFIGNRQTRMADVEYVEAPALAPTQEMLDAYKKKKGS
ncbi:MAG: hypothetical protein ACREE6_11610 [Limisphaerales bacterium]